MTDKECINGLEVLKQIPHAKNFVEHIDFAIKTLEQRPILDKENMKRLEVFDLGYKYGYVLGFTDGVKEYAKTRSGEGMQNDK